MPVFFKFWCPSVFSGVRDATMPTNRNPAHNCNRFTALDKKFNDNYILSQASQELRYDRDLGSRIIRNQE